MDRSRDRRRVGRALTRLAVMMIRLATDGDRDAIFALGVAEEAA
jgi:hypothetical protein